MNMYEYVEIRDVDILLESLISVLDSRTFRGLFLNTSSFREAVRESISQNRRGGKTVEMLRLFDPFLQIQIVFAVRCRRQPSPYRWIEQRRRLHEIGRLTPLITESTIGWGRL